MYFRNRRVLMADGRIVRQWPPNNALQPTHETRG